MNFKHLRTLSAILAGCMLFSCQSDIDFSNIDPKSEVDMGVALPLGSLRATLGDFIGHGEIPNLVVDQDSVFHYIDTIQLPVKEYRYINLKDYIIKNETTLEFKIKEQTGGASLIPASPTAVQLRFPMELGMQGINTDATNERIDSIWISKALFYSTINTNHFDLKWSDIESVQLELGKQFKHPDGKYVTIPISGYGYGQKIEIPIEDFMLDLMDPNDHTPGHTVNKIKFWMIFNVKPSAPITVYEDSKFTYDMEVSLIDHKAIWGLFEAGNQMRDQGTIVMDSVWDGWKDVKELKVRFAEPSIDVHVWHKVAAPLLMHIDYLKAVNSDGDSARATWAKTSGAVGWDEFPLDNKLTPDKPLDASVENHRRFSNSEYEGHIDQLFDVRPDTFHYSYYLKLDRNVDNFPQHRIVKDVGVTGYAAVDIPFKFKDSVNLDYSTIMDSKNLTRYQLDSLLALVDLSTEDVEVKTSDLYLIVDIENYIPFNLEANLIFYDSLKRELPLNLIENKEKNEILLKAPTIVPGSSGYGEVTEPSKERFVLSVDKNDFDRLAEIKSIYLHASIIGNDNQPCRIKTDAALVVHIGVSGRIDAVVDVDKIINGGN